MAATSRDDRQRHGSRYHFGRQARAKRRSDYINHIYELIETHGLATAYGHMERTGLDYYPRHLVLHIRERLRIEKLAHVVAQRRQTKQAQKRERRA